MFDMKEWRKKNKEHLKEYQRKRQQRFNNEQPEKVKAINKRYYWKHREKQLEDGKVYRLKRRLLVITQIIKIAVYVVVKNI